MRKEGLRWRTVKQQGLGKVIWTSNNMKWGESNKGLLDGWVVRLLASGLLVLGTVHTISTDEAMEIWTLLLEVRSKEQQQIQDDTEPKKAGTILNWLLRRWLADPLLEDWHHKEGVKSHKFFMKAEMLTTTRIEEISTSGEGGVVKPWVLLENSWQRWDLGTLWPAAWWNL